MYYSNIVHFLRIELLHFCIRFCDTGRKDRDDLRLVIVVVVLVMELLPVVLVAVVLVVGVVVENVLVVAVLGVSGVRMASGLQVFLSKLDKKQ